MKKYTFYKTLQLVLVALLALFVLLYIFPNSEIYHLVANDATVRVLATVIWGIFGLSFIFIYLDFNYFFNYRKDYRAMEYAARTDTVAGIANRFSCDAMIEKYQDKPLPNNIGCVMIDLTNIQSINNEFGHVQGNIAIRDFSSILRMSSDELCFVGRNGGNKFMALFEDGSPEKIAKFLDNVSKRVNTYNTDSTGAKILYSFGTGFSGNDHVESITGLISLANSRIVR